MNTVRTMPATIAVRSHATIERDESTHVVPRSGLKRLGYTDKQRAQLRAIKAEMACQR